MHRTEFQGYIEKEFIFEQSKKAESIIVKTKWTPGGSDLAEYIIVEARLQNNTDGLTKYPFYRSQKDWAIVFDKLGVEQQ